MVMECVQSVTYLVMNNGKQCGRIVPSRGLRQRDPLSPFLFLLCVEGLSCQLKKAACEGSIQGVSMARQGPKISHMFFVDDNLIFCRAKLADYFKLVDILKTYEQASGEMVNLDKSGVVFSNNISNIDKEKAMNILNIHRLMENENYLGLPFDVWWK